MSTAVRSGMSAPGIHTAVAITALRRAAVSITRSTTCGRSAGILAASAGPEAPLRSAIRRSTAFCGKRPRFTASTASGSMPRTRTASTAASMGISTPSSTTRIGRVSRPTTSRSARVSSSSVCVTSPP